MSSQRLLTWVHSLLLIHLNSNSLQVTISVKTLSSDAGFSVTSDAISNPPKKFGVGAVGLDLHFGISQ